MTDAADREPMIGGYGSDDEVSIDTHNADTSSERLDNDDRSERPANVLERGNDAMSADQAGG
jgi:hypothetical protein